MLELTIDNLRDYLVAGGKVRLGQAVEIICLAGGVSNVVFRVAPEGGPPFVIKQSRAQLRTKADWFSRLDRIFREVEAQRLLSEILPAGGVPEILFEDRENYCYAMSAVRADHAVWKQQLLGGQVDAEIFELAGRLLGQIHARSARRRDRLIGMADTTVFFELRVDPFYRRIADVHPTICESIQQVIAEMAAHPFCLVHADFSPKNILVHPNGITLVDHETVHLGDPAFDLGFFFSHLWLKAIALPSSRAEIISGIDTAWRAYQTELAAESIIPFEPLSRRAVRHLAACLLSRVDGKSTVDYLHDEIQRGFIRAVTLAWLNEAPQDLSVAFQELRQKLMAG